MPQSARIKDRLHQLEIHLNAAARCHGFNSFWQKVAYEAMDDNALLKELLGYYFPKLKSIEAKVETDMPSRLIINLPGTEGSLELGKVEQNQLERPEEVLNVLPPILVEEILDEKETV